MEIIDIRDWSYYKEKSPSVIGGIVYDFVSSKYYEKVIDGEEWSCGLFFIGEKPVLKAWGKKSEEACSYHSLYANGAWTKAQKGCSVSLPIYENEIKTGFVFTHNGKNYTFTNN